MRTGLLLRSFAVALCACSTPSTTSAPPAAERPKPSASAGAVADAATPPDAPRGIDDAMRDLSKQLPDALTLSEQNGASLECVPKRWETYTHLYGLASRLPNNGDADLIALVPWAHANDPCIRQIAIDAIVARIKLDRNRLVAPDMHEPDSRLFHEILVELRDYLRARNVAMPPNLFAGELIDIAPADLATFRGSWAEKANKSRSIQLFVELDATTLRVKHHHEPPDRNFPDSTLSVRIQSVTVDKRGAFQITGTQVDQPSVSLTYGLTPVSSDVAWFTFTPSSWVQIHRTRK
jgi:hypothetical protein